MRRFTLLLNIVGLVVVVALGVELWKLLRENERNSQRLAALDRSTSNKSVAEQRAVPASLPSAALAVSRSTTSEAGAALSEAEQRDRSIIAAREEEYARRNALNHFAPGLAALSLAPATLDRAKEIILKQTRVAADARKMLATAPAEADALMKQTIQARDDELRALLGVPAVEQLQAHALESSLDWATGTEMWEGDVSLTPAQLHALAEVRSRIGYRPTNWTVPVPPDAPQTPNPQTELSSQDLALLSAMGDSLSPAQLEVLRRGLIEENRYNAAMRGFRDKQMRLWRAQNPR